MAAAGNWPRGGADEELLDVIKTVGDPIRDFLGGLARQRLIALLDEAIADPKRTVFAALFEMNDPELIAKLSALGARANVVLGNSSGGTATGVKETDDSAAVIGAAGVKVTRRNTAPGSYAHNKFVVFCDANGAPRTVWTGSINWTQTGVCTQNNNGLEITDDKIAAAYHEHWKAIYADGSKSPKALAVAGDHEWPFTIGESKVSVWFTPTTRSGDLKEATRMIEDTEHGAVCLMLNPGNKGLLGPILEKAQDKNLYVRGVLNNFPAQGKDSPKDQLQLLAGDGQQQVFKGKQIADVIRPAGIDKTADWWEHEIKNTGKFMIAVHSKVIVLDPAGKNPVVMTGSHNFSDRASTKNDDNLIIIRGDSQLALTYAARIVSIYGQYRWQAWRNTPEGQKDKGLKRSDTWLSNRIGKGWAETETRFWLGTT